VSFNILSRIPKLKRRARQAGAAEFRTIASALERTGVPTYRFSLAQFVSELGRARRYQRPLTVAVLGMEDELTFDGQARLARGGNGNGSHSVPPMQTVQLAFLLLGSILRDALRESDLVTFDPLGYQYIVLLAHSSKTEASRAVRRVQDLIVERSALHCRVGLAEFPTDGFTIADLVTKAREECQLPLSSTSGSWRE